MEFKIQGEYGCVRLCYVVYFRQKKRALIFSDSLYVRLRRNMASPRGFEPLLPP